MEFGGNQIIWKELNGPSISRCITTCDRFPIVKKKEKIMEYVLMEWNENQKLQVWVPTFVFFGTP